MPKYLLLHIPEMNSHTVLVVLNPCTLDDFGGFTQDIANLHAKKES